MHTVAQLLSPTLVQQANPELRFELTVAGDGPEASSVAALVRNRNIHNLTLVGPVSGAAKVELLTRSDVLLFPTCHGEGMPNVVLVAMLYTTTAVRRRFRQIIDRMLDSAPVYPSPAASETTGHR